jgi:hypothetical protein
MRGLLSAELLKLARQPGLLFWGFLSIPVAALCIKVVQEGFSILRSGSLPRGQTDLILSAAQSSGIAGSPLAQMLYAIGVSSIFYTEYRLSTWRNLVPRAGRFQLLCAKFAVCIVCMLAGLSLTLVGDVVLQIVLANLEGGGLVVGAAPEGRALVLGGAFAIAVLELATLAALVAAITVAFRSMIAAVVPVFLIGIGCSVMQAYFGASVASVPMPSFAADAARAWLFAGAEGPDGIMGFATLLAWFLAAAAAGSLMFQRQSLSAE